MVLLFVVRLSRVFEATAVAVLTTSPLLKPRTILKGNVEG
jgi:hypothetical protein